MDQQTDNMDEAQAATLQDALGAAGDDPMAEIVAEAADAKDAESDTAGGGRERASSGGAEPRVQLDASATDPGGMSALSHVPVEVQVVLGGARMPIGNVLKLSRGAVVEIDRKVGEQVDIHINNRPVARGEIIIVDEDRLGVTLTEIINVQAGLR